MRSIHIPHLHKPDWHHIREQVIKTFRDPVFWTILILFLIVFALLFFLAAGPVLPPSSPYAPMYPFAGY